MSRPIKLIALLKANPGMTKEQFRKRWIEEHTLFTLKFPKLKGYTINIAIEDFQQIEGELPYDGTAELYWDSLEDLQSDFASEEAKIAGVDADLFTIIREHIFTVETIIKARD